MASLTRLRRRLLRWQRYAVATGWTSEWAKLVRSRPPSVWHYNSEPRQRAYARRHRLLLGLVQAAAAVDVEEDRRFWADTLKVWLGGPAGEQALIADVTPPAEPCDLCQSRDCPGDCWADDVCGCGDCLVPEVPYRPVVTVADLATWGQP
jgi:hypothetical protein